MPYNNEHPFNRCNLIWANQSDERDENASIDKNNNQK